MNLNSEIKILVTGGAGFIGSSVIRYLINDLKYKVVNVDKLTYAGNLESLESVFDSPLYSFENVNICDRKAIKRVFERHQPDKIIHLAAESHVDRSIDQPIEFIQTNIVGTYVMLDVSKWFWSSLSKQKKSKFRFHHISTDEVFGEIEDPKRFFTEKTPYSPNSPYSASKASSDHLVRAWYRTYNLPTIVSNCSNNYGPYQFPEKLIPLIIINVLGGKVLPVYGMGTQIRDWLYVEDHTKALLKVLLDGEVGETYNIGGNNEISNIEIVKKVCSILDNKIPNHPQGIKKYEELISYVEDRPGHDKRYAIDSSKISKNLDWKPIESLDTGIRKTVDWYIKNKLWWQKVLDGTYQGERLGLGGNND